MFLVYRLTMHRIAHEYTPNIRGSCAKEAADS
jgi:hypothetical protein